MATITLQTFSKNICWIIINYFNYDLSIHTIFLGNYLMNTGKLLLTTALTLTINLITCSSQIVILTVIRDASYVVYKNSLATFYTFDGKKIESDPHRTHFEYMEQQLDSSAKKPQPTTYKLEYWPANGKKMPGDFITFYDKNGNEIRRYRFCEKNNTITVFDSAKPKTYTTFDDLFGSTKTKTYTFDASNPQATQDFPLDLSIVKKVTP